MAALVASRRNPVIAAFYRRLPENAKSSRSQPACMRKLLVILNAILRSTPHGKPLDQQDSRSSSLLEGLR
jgi:transposase